MSKDLFLSYQNVTVLGAAGKMGRGIVLLLAQKMLQASLVDHQQRVLNAIDLSLEGLNKMLEYIEIQANKYAKKKLASIRELYVHDQRLAEEADFVGAYTKDLLGIITISNALVSAYDSKLIFEAAAEKVEVKASLFKTIDVNNNHRPYYFTNTSSIPIAELEKESNIESRIIGFHFYNPPPVQKLMEIIRSESTEDELVSLADDMALALNKTVVYAPDKAGFIGNGQFIREISFAIGLAQELSEEVGLPQALYQINEVTKNLLLRPMGIFELMDYVGVNVCTFIMGVMKSAFPNEVFHEGLLEQWLQAGKIGGQNTQGKTQNGIFDYQSGQIAGAFDLKEYQSITPLEYGALSFQTWKELRSLSNRLSAMSDHFAVLRNSDQPLAALAIRYGQACHNIGKGLVAKGIAYTDEDVNKVMTLGFHHLYGPINPFFNQA